MKGRPTIGVGVSWLGAIAQPLPYQRIAENIAFNHLDHRRNMRGDFSQTGIGIARTEAGEYDFT